MLTVETALENILRHAVQLSSERVSILDAAGRALAEEVRARHDLPPFDNSAMDGYAVIAADIRTARLESPVHLAVIEDIPAGHAPTSTVGARQAARIMTGAPMPAGADAVVPVELTTDPGDSSALPAEIEILEPVPTAANIRWAGEDVRAGDVVLSPGRRLRPADIGALAGLGYSEVSVVRRPRVAVLSTGDELLTPEQPLQPGRIRDMNGYSLPAMIMALGATPVRLGVATDTVEDVRQRLLAAVDQGADLILSSAGVSVGAYDVVKAVLEELGSVDFWKVNMRPGKPLTFGHVRGVPFLGLPGNPVSALVTFMVFVRPLVMTLLGLDHHVHTRNVRVGETMQSDGRQTYARVRVEYEHGDLVAYSTGTQSSGAISSMVKADGLIIIPAGLREVRAGETLAFWSFDQVI
ncbi:MAG: molybdopterin molybdotransferase MoeA [Chloroflexi bacterium]|nr:molybdopterin molybdotransferase MoeA [Chloroflexota bacterium]